MRTRWTAIWILASLSVVAAVATTVSSVPPWTKVLVGAVALGFLTLAITSTKKS
ncbi:hypothetical protein SAMN05421812_107197 [Asanoa hainanensis]|uniref:MYXO-CTERM domain-containing protein n=1 Tax=Asanoa hainanensis TaxID=560556 RepID=A0A239N2X4_9ACTN|nr:hypothetical protein SAMN05421812_107197 [Asanoa hainanensis]